VLTSSSISFTFTQDYLGTREGEGNKDPSEREGEEN